MRLSSVVVVWAALVGCGGVGPATMEFVEVVPAQPRIGDVATIRFRLIDERGVPLAGQQVTFKLASENSGVTLSPVSTVSIRGNGFAETQIVASGRVNSVIVIATSGGKQVQSPAITFAGTVPSWTQLSLGCGPTAGEGSGGRHALGAYDQTRFLIPGSHIPCTAHVGDRNSDGVEGALVSFLTEAGTIGPSNVSQANLIGDATVLFKTSQPLPVETTPGQFSWNPDGADGTNPLSTGDYIAPLWMHPFNWSEDPRVAIPITGSGGLTVPSYSLREPRRPDPIRQYPNGQRRENNPRDNLVTLIAVTSGEEGFTDSNNNGVFDDGEVFVDLTEPFVDADDNGTWSADEKFIDVNGDRTWNGKNGKWDSNTLIWRADRMLWTGIPASEDVADTVPNVVGHKPTVTTVRVPGQPADAQLNLVCPAGTAVGAPCIASSLVAFAYIADPWFNSLARNGDNDGCSLDTDDKAPVEVSAPESSGFAFTYPPGNFINFEVSDKRDPGAAPADQIGRRSPPVPFSVSLSCLFTSSTLDPYLLKLGVGTLRGTIE